MFWNKKKEVEEIVNKVKATKLTIFFKNNTSWAWDTDIVRDSDYKKPYINFIKWYFSRPQSDKYVFKFRGGEQMFLREDILKYEIKVIEVVR